MPKGRIGKEFNSAAQLTCTAGHPVGRSREPLPPHGVLQCEHRFERTNANRCGLASYVLVLDTGDRLVWEISIDEMQAVRKGRMTVAQALKYLELFALEPHAL